VVPQTIPNLRFQVELAAEQAGVDSVLEENVGCTVVHFIARHQDRRVTTNPPRRASKIRSVLRLGGPEQTRPAPPSVDLLAFQRASDELALDMADDTESEQIWHQLLQAQPRAHICAGIPTLVLNDVGGIVGVLRRRADRRGALVRVNPDVCGCA